VSRTHNCKSSREKNVSERGIRKPFWQKSHSFWVLTAAPRKRGESAIARTWRPSIMRTAAAAQHSLSRKKKMHAVLHTHTGNYFLQTPTDRFFLPPRIGHAAVVPPQKNLWGLDSASFFCPPQLAARAQPSSLLVSETLFSPSAESATSPGRARPPEPSAAVRARGAKC
jgi:hypothetical protein